MQIVPLEFEGFNIRVTPEGKFAATDVLKAIGQADPRNAWKNAKARHPEIVDTASTYSFGGRGRPSEVLERPRSGPAAGLRHVGKVCRQH